MKGASLDSCPANGGHGSHSYSKNSHYQKSFVDIVRIKVEEEIKENFNTTHLISSSSSNTIRLADLGCATGPNTFWTMQYIVNAIKSNSPNISPNFQVFFNDQISNDFNALFLSLPPDRDYFAAAAPGSFHGRLFPDSSLHLVHTAYSIHWLSAVPEEVKDKRSAAWNGGRIHYIGAAEGVVEAYAGRFSADMERFLKARAEEMVGGGIMVMICLGVCDDVSPSQLPFRILYDNLAFALIDMAKEGLLNEDEVDSFNIPIFIPCPKKMRKLIEKDGHFSIERIELAEPATWLKENVDIRVWINHIRAAMEGTFIQHFKKKELIDEMFERVIKKLSNYPEEINEKLHEKVQLFAVLKRKDDAF
ncbi:loganic acid O-methyltransferase [Cucumis sativus]|uniref:S-adenosylmethionine-dependent methyltransferase n=1 Tax=Cucumis sativus TaxID=3659 RepID=A0A0A0KM78_CUCSA|nr:loganic acid O-methyltransferase [Cucumis sativus]KGN50765.1 hypothetical protein Csa_005807 [Cucumis sativus]